MKLNGVECDIYIKTKHIPFSIVAFMVFGVENSDMRMDMNRAFSHDSNKFHKNTLGLTFLGFGASQKEKFDCFFFHSIFELFQTIADEA